ncbi:hypothetical protein DHEL01_v207664 [Diaporthe helianthi]|uniref:Uncharacterized protein n=1 Tax=Diaporthe helianthi TaxID=158607 RepID=A0A2P5HUM0_DIAHE|nr:hypothetical protein DHEL01_v207664 [Diaporthe helianthi]
MKKFKTAVSKIYHRGSHESTTAIKEGGTELGGDNSSQALWTTGQEFQFYVPWLWKDSPEPPPEKLHPNRQIVRIPRLTNLPGFTDEFRDAWIQQCVANAVKYLVYDKQHYPTCTQSELEQRKHDKTEAWKQFNIVQRECNLPKITLPGYDGVLPMEMTIIIKQLSVRQGTASSPSSLEWCNLPTPGKCIERIKNQVKIYLTRECSIHIHIRPVNMLAFDLVTFKKMASLLWLAEDRLDQLYHPARCRPNSPSHHSLRNHSNLALDNSPLLSNSVDDHAAVLGFLNPYSAEKKSLTTIWQTINHHQLRELLLAHPSIGQHEFLAYNFFNIHMNSEKQTIEFRKTESTRDGQVIDAWIEVFVLLAYFCTISSTQSFQRVMEDLVKPQDEYSTWKLLGDIGCNRLTVDVLRQKSMDQWLPLDPAARWAPREADSPTTARRKLAPRPRLLDAVRRGTKKFGGMIARGSSYGC